MSVDLTLVPPGPPGDRDWGYLAQQKAEAHVDLCEQWREFYEGEGYADEGENVPEPDQPDPAVGPYCGCMTCIIRETLHAGWPVIEAAIRSGDFDG